MNAYNGLTFSGTRIYLFVTKQNASVVGRKLSHQPRSMHRFVVDVYVHVHCIKMAWPD